MQCYDRSREEEFSEWSIRAPHWINALDEAVCRSVWQSYRCQRETVEISVQCQVAPLSDVAEALLSLDPVLVVMGLVGTEFRNVRPRG